VINCPFPGIDPYLEYPALWGSLQARLIVEIANQLQPRLDPHYIASIEKRVYLEIDNLEIQQTRVEILDAYRKLKLVAQIEVVSPTNKADGPGRVSYKAKQQETLARECHLTEIDLLGHGRHVLCIPEWRVKPFKPFDSLCCVSRWPLRNRFELYPRTLHQRLPRLKIPLAEEDSDVAFDLQEAFEQVYVDGRYWRRARYDRKCQPRLSYQDQIWADERITGFQAARPDLFPR
jgi:Protein of unknown function (DUF4058)